MRKETARAEKIAARIEALAAYSEDGAGVLTRRYGTPVFLAAAEKILEWMKAAGLRARIDAIGNVRGILLSDRPGAKTLVIGSHYDTVINAGRWDGPLGVLMGLDLLENIAGMGKKLPFHIELIAFCDEEGVRYHSTYLGSRVIAGSFDPALLVRRDAGGVSLGEAIRCVGGDPAPASLAAEAIAIGDWLGYFEIHIEQGPVLYERRVPVAPVSAIAGQVRAELRFYGAAGHAGTVPMDMRADALCGASEFVLGVERLACGGRVLATVGKLQVCGAASNVIPGEVICSVDIRSAGETALSGAEEAVRQLASDIGERRGLRVEWETLQTAAPVSCDTAMMAVLTEAIEACGHSSEPLVSGAGHDAVPISSVAPVCMLFVRCYKGISHNPEEYVETEDIAAAVAVADAFVLALADKNV